MPRFTDPNELLLSQARELDKQLEQSREAMRGEKEARRREQEERDAVQKGIYKWGKWGILALIIIAVVTVLLQFLH